MAESTESWPEWPICLVSDITDPGAKGFNIGDGDWPFRGFIVRQGTEIFAYANVCPHRRHPLDMLPDEFLTPDGQTIRCSSHGALFSPETGLCLVGPCAGRHLLKLDSRIDPDQRIMVTAPESLRDAGSIVGPAFDTI